MFNLRKSTTVVVDPAIAREAWIPFAALQRSLESHTHFLKWVPKNLYFWHLFVFPLKSLSALAQSRL